MLRGMTGAAFRATRILVLLLLSSGACARSERSADGGSPPQPGPPPAPPPSAGWFATGQRADLMLSGAGFNDTGPLQFNHPSGIASDGERFLLCDRFNNRVLVWTSLPDRWDAPPALVLGQPDFTSNDPGTARA